MALVATLGYRFYFTTAALLLASLAYAYVGRILAQRTVVGRARPAHHAFTIWWFALATATLTYGIRNLLVIFDAVQLSYFLTLLQVYVVATAVALAGLVTYLLFLFAGNLGRWRLVAAFYGIYYVFYTHLLFYSEPAEVLVGPVSTTFRYEGPASAIVLPLVAAFYVPQFVAAITYGSLLFKARGATQRYRVGLVSLSIVIWSATNMVVQFGAETGQDRIEFYGQLFNLLAPLGVVLAYFPPRWIRARLGVESVRTEAPPA